MARKIWLYLVLMVLAGCARAPLPPAPEVERIEEYAVRARILSKKGYDNPYAPVDVVLAWGPLLPTETTQEATVLQDDRWGWVMANNNDVPRDILQRNTANTHLITLDRAQREAVSRLRAGQTAYFEGHLANVKFADGKQMNSSVSREDVGNHACEVLVVKKITIIDDGS